jgi:molybdopterin biosynthesis enzyme MoaB
VERSSVHLAILVVADDPATVDLASATFLADRLTGAGHRIVAQEVVEHQEAAIRDQLARWVAQGHIDVIIAAGAGDVAAAALAPLVTRPIAGLTDQLRLLARDRGSADKPVAARASTKFVFLLPHDIGALGAALNQLVLPQLDSTAERNLVGDMPRLKPPDAVPQAIAAEKTATGAGVAPKLPATTREKRKTGAYVIPRRDAGLDDPTKQTRVEDPTKPVELEARGRARTAPGAHDAPTRPHIALASMLPPVPPGADIDTSNDTPALLEGPPPAQAVTVQPARARDAVGTAKPAPGANDVIKVAPAPSAAQPVKPLRSLKPLRPFPETIKPPTKLAESKPSAAPAKPTAPAAAPATRLPALTPVSGTRANPAANAAVPAASAATRPAATATPAQKPAPKPEPKDAEEAIEAASSADLIEAAAADIEEVPPARPTSARPPAVPTRPATGPAPVVPARPATGPAPVVPARPATGPVPVVPANGAAVRPPTGPVPAVPAAASSAGAVPTFAPPELLDLREGTQKKRRPRTGTALVRPSSRAPILMYLALALAAVAGFVAVVHFMSGTTTKRDERVARATPRAGSAAIVQPAGSAAGSSVGSSSAGSDTNDIDVEPPPAHGTSAAPAPGATTVPSHGTTAAAHTHDAAPHGAVARPAPAHDTPPAGSAAQGDVKEPPPQPTEDGCDEVSCVLDKYARACCAKFRPSDEAFHPKGTVPDSLDKAMVKAGIEKVKPKVVACGEKIAAKGIVKLAITVAPEGNISDISVADAPDAALGDCVLAAVKRATFAKSVNGASFTYPFAF